MRLMKYRTPRVDEINVGLQPHVDRNFLAVLDTNHVTGLEIETKDGQWITYKPSPSTSTFLVIAGEPFQVRHMANLSWVVFLLFPYVPFLTT
jgi:isopenicillin N synthase-like dioxygenase